jgi:hypothetical protein
MLSSKRKIEECHCRLLYPNFHPNLSIHLGVLESGGNPPFLSALMLRYVVTWG